MIWEDECYLLSKRKFRENANIINIFSNKNGKVSGIVYGGNSRKVRNYLQISNKLFVINNTKNESRKAHRRKCRSRCVVRHKGTNSKVDTNT